jgi:hypothetical protein
MQEKKESKLLRLQINIDTVGKVGENLPGLRVLHYCRNIHNPSLIVMRRWQ